MGADYTRLTFNPENHFVGVRMQQGRVQLDSDWNELVDILERGARARSLDTFGPCAVPQETPDAFHIRVAHGTLSIGAGRLYVDGLLAENRGQQDTPASATVDPLLGEFVGDQPLDYTSQPFFPQPPALPSSGAGIAYLVAWQREVTAIEDPDLVERALGIDTTTRLQSVWQVRLRPIGQQHLSAGDVEGSPEWQALIRPPAGRLTTTPVGSLDGGPRAYTGGENRLYRIEVHDSGPAGTATFKWSSLNASVVSQVTSISADRTQLVLAQIRRDRLLGIQPGDWVEVIDDVLELGGQTGAMAWVEAADTASGILKLASALPEGLFDPSESERHTRVRRWDQTGTIVDVNGHAYVDLADSGGVIPVPVDSSTRIVLEDGIAVSFSGGTPHTAHASSGRPRTRVVGEEELVAFFEDGSEEIIDLLLVEPEPPGSRRRTRRRHQSPVGQDYRTGDFWTFAARADGWLESLAAAPPRGVWRHYCPLAIVNFPNNALDLRVHWPPRELASSAETVGCSVHVSAAGHNSGTHTIQQAIDRMKGTGGSVCLGPGLFVLNDPLDLTRAESIGLAGVGWASVLSYSGSGSAIRVEQSAGIRIERLTVVAAATPAGRGDNLLTLLGRGMSGTAAQLLSHLQQVQSQLSGAATSCVDIADSVDVQVERCLVIQLAEATAEVPAIALSGVVLNADVDSNAIVGASGIANRQLVSQPTGSYLVDMAKATQAARRSEVDVPYLVTAGLAIENNGLWCSRTGVSLAGLSIHLAETRISGNHVSGGEDGGIVLTGATPDSDLRGSRGLTVERNDLQVGGPGIIVGTDNAQIRDNAVRPATTLRLDERTPVNEALTPLPAGPERDSGIVVTRGLRLDRTHGCKVIGNQVIGVAGHAIVVTTVTGDLWIESNEVAEVGGMGIEMRPASAGAYLVVRGNRMRHVVRVPRNGTLPAAAIRLLDVTHVEVVDNTLHGMGQTALGSAGRDGIQLRQCGVIRVRGNDLRDFGLDASPLPDSAGIAIDAAASSEIEVSANVVRLGTTPVAPSWHALRIGTPPQTVVQQEALHAAVGRGQIFSRLFVASRPQAQAAETEGDASPLPAQPLVSVRGNLLEAQGPASTVEIAISGLCTFTDNQCLRAASALGQTPIVLLQSAGAIFSSNFVLGSGNVAVDIVTGSNGQTNQAWSVVGNVCDRQLRVNMSAGNPTSNVNFANGIG